MSGLRSECIRNTYNIDDAVVVSTLIRLQVVLEALGVLGDLTTLGNVQVVGHAAVEREHRRSSTDFGTHVANRSHASARKRLNARASVLNNGASSALDRKNTSDLEDDI